MRFQPVAHEIDQRAVRVAAGGVEGDEARQHLAHGGADVAWYFTGRVGLGALVRFTTAMESVAIGSGQSFDLEAGGFQAGLGLRIRF